MIESQGRIERDSTKYIPTWSKPVAGMHMVFGDHEDQFRIQQTRNLIYCVHGRPLHMHLFTHWTRLEDKKYPIVLHIRGSGWCKQDVDGFLPQMTDIARAGYVVASIEYRDTGEGYGFPAQIEDAKAAIHYLQQHADEYSLDPERVAVWGDSAGGHTALMTGFTAGTANCCAPEEKGIDLCIKAIIDFFGPSNFKSFGGYPCGVNNTVSDASGKMLLKKALYNYPDIEAAASPVNYVSNQRELPPTLIIHGDRDCMCPFSQSVELYEKMRDCGQSVDFYMVRNAEHGTYIWTEKVFEIVKDFIRAHL